jgi:hypothetical protein
MTETDPFGRCCGPTHLDMAEASDMVDSLMGELESEGDEPWAPSGGGEACGMLKRGTGRRHRGQSGRPRRLFDTEAVGPAPPQTSSARLAALDHRQDVRTYLSGLGMAVPTVTLDSDDLPALDMA